MKYQQKKEENIRKGIQAQTVTNEASKDDKARNQSLINT